MSLPTPDNARRPGPESPRPSAKAVAAPPAHKAITGPRPTLGNK